MRSGVERFLAWLTNGFRRHMKEVNINLHRLGVFN
jgi:hypothetical protein